MKAFGIASALAFVAGMAQAEGSLALYNWGRLYQSRCFEEIH
jgi:hypothetical protein